MTRRWQRSARGNRRTSAAKIARSAQSRRGRGLVRRRMATSWRSTRSSMSLVVDVRPIRRTNPSTWRRIKYSNRNDTSRSCPTSDHRWSATQARLLAPHTLAVPDRPRHPTAAGRTQPDPARRARRGPGRRTGRRGPFRRDLRHPVATTFHGKGVLADDHPCAVGTVGFMRRDYVNFGFDDADLIIAVGYELQEFDPARINPDGDKQIIHIHRFPAEVDAHYIIDVGIEGDLGASLDALAAAAAGYHPTRRPTTPSAGLLRDELDHGR